jgi:hypothetical protein
MQVLELNYDFYKMPEEQRRAMVGDYFVEKASLARLGPELVDRYYPIQLTEQGSWMNYNRRQGVLHLTPIWPYRDYSKRGKLGITDKKIFRLTCFSPDDLDLALEWIGPPDGLRAKVIALLDEMPKDEVEYQECLEFIQSFHGGEIGL